MRPSETWDGADLSPWCGIYPTAQHRTAGIRSPPGAVLGATDDTPSVDPRGVDRPTPDPPVQPVMPPALPAPPPRRVDAKPAMTIGQHRGQHHRARSTPKITGQHRDQHTVPSRHPRPPDHTMGSVTTSSRRNDHRAIPGSAPLRRVGAPFRWPVRPAERTAVQRAGRADHGHPPRRGVELLPVRRRVECRLEDVRVPGPVE